MQTRAYGVESHLVTWLPRHRVSICFRMVAELLVLFHPWKRAWQLSRSDSRSDGIIGSHWRASLTVQSLVDTKAIGKPPTLSGDIDTPEGMPWSQWSFVFRSYLGAYDSVATRLLQQIEAKVEDPSVVDNASMTEAERRLSVQLFYVLALTCKGKSLQVVRRVPEG